MFQVRIADQRLLLGKEAEDLRWFLLPSEAADLMSGKPMSHLPRDPPFTPRLWNNCSTETKNSLYLDEVCGNGVVQELTTTEMINKGDDSNGSECFGDKKGFHHHYNHNDNSITTNSCLGENNGSGFDCRLSIRKEKEEDDCKSSEEFPLDNAACFKNSTPQDSFSGEQGTPLKSETESKEKLNTEDLNSSIFDFAQQTQRLSSTNSELVCTYGEWDEGDRSSPSKYFKQKTSELSESCTYSLVHKTQNKSKTDSSARILNKDVTEGNCSFASSNGVQQTDTNQQSLKVVPNEAQTTCASCVFQGRKELPVQTAVRSKPRFQSPPKTIFKPAVQVRQGCIALQ